MYADKMIDNICLNDLFESFYLDVACLSFTIINKIIRTEQPAEKV